MKAFSRGTDSSEYEIALIVLRRHKGGMVTVLKDVVVYVTKFSTKVVSTMMLMDLAVFRPFLMGLSWLRRII